MLYGNCVRGAIDHHRAPVGGVGDGGGAVRVEPVQFEAVGGARWGLKIVYVDNVVFLYSKYTKSKIM